MWITGEKKMRTGKERKENNEEESRAKEDWRIKLGEERKGELSEDRT